jgi:hypothetical protein
MPSATALHNDNLPATAVAMPKTVIAALLDDDCLSFGLRSYRSNGDTDSGDGSESNKNLAH